MKTVIIGGGLIGVTTAYFLSRRGHEVTVIDRHESAGRETSFANGGLLTPSMSEPWNAPGSWRVLLSSIGRSDSAMQLRLRALPALMGWGVTFLRNSGTEAFERNALSNFRLATYSLKIMSSLRQQTGVQYGGTERGSLKIFRCESSLEKTFEASNRLFSEGQRFRRLSRKEIVELEPILEPVANQLAGAIHYETDETGDAYRFCVAMAEQARSQGVEFIFGTEISSLDMYSGRVKAVVTKQRRFSADQYIVAAGSHSTPLLRNIGVHLPVRPVKGYSVTFDKHPGPQALGIPLVDDDLHAAVVPLNGGIRVAGTAEFDGYNLSLQQSRIRNLLSLLREVLPTQQFEMTTARPWCGLRPMCADGVPIIGSTFIPNLMVNTGHGHLGWTMAAGSAKLLADLICGDDPGIDPTPFAQARFAD